MGARARGASCWLLGDDCLKFDSPFLVQKDVQSPNKQQQCVKGRAAAYAYP